MKIEQVLRFEGDFTTLIVEENDSTLEYMDLYMCNMQVGEEISIADLEDYVGGLQEVLADAKSEFEKRSGEPWSRDEQKEDNKA